MSRVNPVGAKTSGRPTGRPSSVVEGSTTETSRSTRGRELHALERLPGAPQADLRPGRAVGVVEHRPRHPAAGDLAEVADRGGAGQPPVGRVAGRDGAGGPPRAAPTSGAPGGRPRRLLWNVCSATLPGGPVPRARARSAVNPVVPSAVARQQLQQRTALILDLTASPARECSAGPHLELEDLTAPARRPGRTHQAVDEHGAHPATAAALQRLQRSITAEDPRPVACDRSSTSSYSGRNRTGARASGSVRAPSGTSSSSTPSGLP